MTEQFGADAWDNVSYTLVPEPHNSGIGVYVRKETGELLSEEAYRSIVEPFLRDSGTWEIFDGLSWNPPQDTVQTGD